MKTLVLMRHAKSDWNQPGLCDHDRPLNRRGQLAAPIMAQHLASQGVFSDLIISSSAVRVQETINLMRPFWAEDVETRVNAEIYLASPAVLHELVANLPLDRSKVMVVGHNPGLSNFASRLSGKSIEMPTAAVAILTCESLTWATAVQEPWKLQDFWKPKEIATSQ
ncbi:MAG: histidine phosphatase family protein [Planctomycetales bacterium]|nr:histidine phosphatase family protein [Planctomycetales bacterium]